MTVEERVCASYPTAGLVTRSSSSKYGRAYRVEESATGKVLGNWRTLPDWAWQAAHRRLRRRLLQGKTARLK